MAKKRGTSNIRISKEDLTDPDCHRLNRKFDLIEELIDKATGSGGTGSSSGSGNGRPGSPGAQGDPGPSGSAGDPAPNIAHATALAFYTPWAHDQQFGFTGTNDLP